MNEEYTFSKPIYELLVNAKEKYSQPENRLGFVVQHKSTKSTFRNFLSKTENINKVINILYQNHEFYKESEFIAPEKAADLLFRFYEVKAYDQSGKLLGVLLSHDYKFYFKYENAMEYSVIKFENLFETLSDLKLEGSKFHGGGNAARYTSKLKEINNLVKFKY